MTSLPPERSSTVAPSTVAPAGPAGQARPPFVRLLPHLVWEAFLVVSVIGMAIAVMAANSEVLTSVSVLYNIASVGLLACGLALSVRTATPNLAVASLAALAGTVFAELLDAGWATSAAWLTAVAVVTLIGLFFGLVAGLTSVPAWAVSLAGLAATGAIVLAVSGGRVTPLRDLDPASKGSGAFWVAVFCLVSIGGGLLWLLPAVRALLGVNRTAAGTTRLSPRRLLGALVGFGGSSLLAAISGLIMVSQLRAAMPPMSETPRLTLVLGAVLLGGVSAFGRRGGIAGTVLATVLLVLANTLLLVENAPSWVTAGVLPAAAILVGVVIGRVLEAVGGPDPIDASEPART